MDRIHLAQELAQWLTLETKIGKIRFSLTAVKFVTSQVPSLFEDASCCMKVFS
jgi:hypothetical protein